MAAVAEEPVSQAAFKILCSPFLRYTGLRAAASIFYHFFFLQYKAALLPGQIPVVKADHFLDEKIPFQPCRVAVYLDFVSFWIRLLGFILSRFGRRGFGEVKAFLSAMGRLYAFAAEVYKKRLSTTERPRYLKRPRFVLIHAADPHLMCIPSLHVMVMILSYTRFRKMIATLDNVGALGGNDFAAQVDEVHRGALEITEAVLYVKQHSVNCIAAAMYAMTCFDEALFPPAEAEDFASRLFAQSRPPAPEDGEAIRAYILETYRSFLAQNAAAPRGTPWEKPLLDFLDSL